MTNEERLKADGWHVNGAKCVTSRAWTKDRLDFYTEDEALVVVLTAERDAAIARAERAEADNDALRKQIATRTEALQTANGTSAAMRARAEAAEALAASRPEITPEDAAAFTTVLFGDAAVYRAEDRVRAALRAHAAKVSR